MNRNLQILAAAVLVFIGADLAQASEDLNRGQERHIGGHGFLPSRYVLDPFVESMFSNYTGAAVAVDLESQLIDVNGTSVIEGDGNLVFATLGLGYQAAIGSNAAVGLAAAGVARSGLDAYSFLAQGADLDRNLDLWARYRVYRDDKNQVSAGVSWSYSKTVYFTPRDFAQHIADGGAIADAPLIISDKVWAAHVTTAWAHSFSPTYGLRMNAEFGLYEAPRNEEVLLAKHRIGVLGEVDFKHMRYEIPVGATLGYTQNFPDSDPYTGPSGWLFGLWYTGREEFVVGLETGFMKLPVLEQDDTKVDAMFGEFSVRYYF